MTGSSSAVASRAAVGHLALGAQVELHELRDGHTDLEQVFLSLVDTEEPDRPPTREVQEP